MVYENRNCQKRDWWLDLLNGATRFENLTHVASIPSTHLSDLDSGTPNLCLLS